MLKHADLCHRPLTTILPRGHLLLGELQLRARQLLPRGLRRAHSVPSPDCACALRLLGVAPIDSAGTLVPGGNFGVPQPLFLELHQRRRYAEQVLKSEAKVQMTGAQRR